MLKVIKYIVLVCKFFMVALGICLTLLFFSAVFMGFTSPHQQFADELPSSSSIALGGGIVGGRKSGHKASHSRILNTDMFSDRITADKPGAFLYARLLRNHNPHVLPVNRTRSAVSIRLLLKLTQIVDVDEKNQIMTTNVWLRHEWFDSSLQWDPKHFGGIETINIPADDIWLPDTILYNNADGDYQITIHTKVMVRYDGMVIWEPPAIYKSFCAINVEFFPYDEQLCEMKVGPWTFDVSKVDYFLINPKNPNGNSSNYEELAVDMGGFYESVEWDILKISGRRRIFKYPCCEEDYVDVTYMFSLRRKTLFYTINLIIPCVAISFLTVLVFYLPCESGEKVALSISILLSLTVFILLLSEIIPPTSLALPLMGKYLLFTMVLVTLSIAVTVLVLYNHFRHPYAYAMPYWVRYVFLDVLPKILMFQQAAFANKDKFFTGNNRNSNKNQQPGNGVGPANGGGNAGQQVTTGDIEAEPFFTRGENGSADSGSVPSPPEIRSWRSSPMTLLGSPRCTCHEMNGNASSVVTGSSHTSKIGLHRRAKMQQTRDYNRMRYGAYVACHEEGRFIIEEALPAFDQYICMPEVQEAMRCIHYIAKRYKDGTIEAKMKAEWEAVSRVLDRLFLFIFSAACSFGTLAILLHAPSLYDTTPALAAINQEEILV